MLDEYPLASLEIMSDQNLINLRLHGVPDFLQEDSLGDLK